MSRLVFFVMLLVCFGFCLMIAGPLMLASHGKKFVKGGPIKSHHQQQQLQEDKQQEEAKEEGQLQHDTHGSIAHKHPYAIIHVAEFGNITFKLAAEAAPRTVANFIEMSNNGAYNNSCFYRYERGFVLQGGMCGGARRKGKVKNVQLEYKLPNVKYSVAIARTSNPNSGGSEFFINLRDSTNALGPKKNGGYAVFAHVVDGLDTIAAMKKQPTVKKKLTLFKKSPIISSISVEYRAK